MKKLSFFLMAMLFSVMSFAQDAAYKTALFGASYNSKKISSYTATWTATNDGFTVTIANANNNNNDWNYIKMGRKNNASVGSITTSVAIDKPIASVTLTIDAITANKINSLTLKTSTDGTTYTEAGTFSKAKGDQTVELTAPAANLYYQIVADCASGSSNGLVTISKVQYFAAEGGEQGPKVAAPVFNVTETAFTEAFTLTITSEEGTTLKYTTDDTDPITSGTAVVVNSNTATIDIPAVSTVVKAVAVKDELVSSVTSVTYCYVNSAETAYTVAEAIAIIDAGLGLDNELYAKGEICQVDSYNATYKSITYWIQDEQGNKLQVYSGKGLNNADFSSKEELVLGARVVICGILKKYNTTYEFDKNNYIVSIEYDEPVIFADDFHFDAIAFGAEVEAQTLTVTAENLTADITATLDNEDFTVTPATLPAAGGDLTIAPAADLAVGEHTATLTLTSGETTKEVALSVLVKDVYAIEWYVNGEIYAETTVVEGDNLVLPAAPEAPEACSKKVFVGWTAAEEVNADGSDIEWVTAAAPTAAATYYAVFAAQEGEGGASEVVDVLNRALTGVVGTNYTDWEKVSATSTAVYAGQSAGGNEAIQLRSNNSNSGVISTTSGGKLAKVVVTWNGETAEGRTLNVYGSNTAYTAPTALYGDASGDKLGTIVCGTSTELVIEGDYAYVGLRSNSGAMYLDEIQITWIAGAAATYTDYSTTCEPEIPTVTLSCTGMDKNYQAWRDLLQLEGTSTNDEYVTVALYNYAATVGDYQAFIAFGDLELETESLTINRGSEEWTLTATIDADTAIYEFTATTAAPKTETIAPRAATWGGDAMNGYTIDCTTTIGDVQILVQDGTEYGMGWMLNMAINDALVVEGATIDAPTWEEDNLVLDVTVVSGTLDEYTIQLTATPKPATEIIANATMALSEDEYEVGTMIVSATWEEHPLSVKLNGWPYYGYGEYAEANLIIEIDPENYDVVDAYSTATLEKKEDVAVLTGTFSDWNGNKYALTLTIAEPAAAPVVETVNVVCTDMVQGEEWGTPVLTGTCNLGDINISLNVEKTDHPESVYGEYGFAEYPMGLFPAVEVTIKGEDSFIMLELMENTVAVYTDGETQDSFVGTFLGSDWKVYALDMKTPAPEGPSAVDNITTTVAPVKAIVNGQLVIVKDGVQYNAQGAVVK